MRRKWCRRRLDMLSIKPRQTAGEKGVMIKLVKSGFSEVRCETLFQKILSWSTMPKKMRKCLWGTSTKRTGVCFLFAYLEVICHYKDFPETWNRARKVSGTQGRFLTDQLLIIFFIFSIFSRKSMLLSFVSEFEKRTPV